jgi:hypothetical protein
MAFMAAVTSFLYCLQHDRLLSYLQDGHLVLDERAIGVAVAGLALALRAPVLVAVALAAVSTALTRAFS